MSTIWFWYRSNTTTFELCRWRRIRNTVPSFAQIHQLHFTLFVVFVIRFHFFPLSWHLHKSLSVLHMWYVVIKNWFERIKSWWRLPFLSMCFCCENGHIQTFCAFTEKIVPRVCYTNRMWSTISHGMPVQNWIITSTSRYGGVGEKWGKPNFDKKLILVVESHVLFNLVTLH